MPPSSWAKRTGFHPKFSGETNSTDSGQITTLSTPAQVQANKIWQTDSNIELEVGRPKHGITSNSESAVAPKQPEIKKKDKDKVPPVRKQKDLGGDESRMAERMRRSQPLLRRMCCRSW